jgi:hypothetical protein
MCGRNIDDHMNYYTEDNSCPEEMISAYSSNGDTIAGTGVPGANPHGKCEVTASGWFWAEIAPGGSWNSLRGTAVTESMTTLLGFGFSGSTGYSTTNGISYVNHSSANTYVCGNGGVGGSLASGKVIYNDNA